MNTIWITQRFWVWFWSTAGSRLQQTNKQRVISWPQPENVHFISSFPSEHVTGHEIRDSPITDVARPRRIMKYWMLSGRLLPSRQPPLSPISTGFLHQSCCPLWPHSPSLSLDITAQGKHTFTLSVSLTPNRNTRFSGIQKRANVPEWVIPEVVCFVSFKQK